MKTQAELRAFAIGCITGIVIFVGSFAGICSLEGIRWVPVQIGDMRDARCGTPARYEAMREGADCS